MLEQLRRIWRGDKERSPWDTSGSFSLLEHGVHQGMQDPPRKRLQPVSRRLRTTVLCVFMIIGFGLTGLGLARDNMYPALIFVVALYFFYIAHHFGEYLESQKEKREQRQEALRILELQKQGLISEDVDAGAIGVMDRRYCFCIFLISVGILAGNWCWVIVEGHANHGNMELAFLAPYICVAYLALTIDPSLGSALRDKKKEILLWAWGVLGLVLGGLNLYLMWR